MTAEPSIDPGPAVDPGPARAWTPEVAAAIELRADHTPVPGLAFVLHAAELLNHYREIWAHLDPSTFEIVIAAELAADHARIAEFAADHGYRASWVGDVLTAGRVFDAAVSNHVGSAGTIGGRNAVPLLALRHVRLMYALGKDAWNFSSWNETYDLILAWGPYQADRLAAFERPRVVQVGYPRFDRFFRLTEPRRAAVARLGGDPDRPTLLWLPTWSAASSIDAFAETIAGLRDTFNVLLKVHPFSATQEPARMARLAELGLASTVDPIQDNLDLLYAADIVAADYGGSAFAAIHTDRDLVLLNTPGVGTDPRDTVVGADSLDVRLREWILNIDPGEGDVVRDHIADPGARQQQRVAREGLRRQLFAPFRGCAGEVAATTLRNLDAILA
jgi:hypothetical protein